MSEIHNLYLIKSWSSQVQDQEQKRNILFFALYFWFAVEFSLLSPVVYYNIMFYTTWASRHYILQRSP